MANFGCQMFDRGCDNTKGCEIGGMTVTRDHLGRNRFRLQAKLGCDMFFDARIDIGKRADRTGNCTGGNFVTCRDQTITVTFEFRIESRKLKTKGHRLCVDAVRTAHAGDIFGFIGALFKGGQKLVHIFKKNVGCLGKLHVKAGIQNVRAGHALMDKTGFFTDLFGQFG